MDANTQCQSRPKLHTIPLWDVGRPRPVGKERRKNTGALDRHAQAATGMPPAESVVRRQRPRQEPLERAIFLWLGAEGAGLEAT